MSHKSSEKESCIQTQQSSKRTALAIIATTLIVLIGVGVVIGLPIILTNIEPPETKFSIVEASIMQFNLTNNTLYYNFEVTITAKNFRDYIESYDKPGTAIASYKGNQLPTVKMAPFKLSGKNIVRLPPIVFEGNIVMIFEPQQLAKYNKEAQLGIYNMDLDLELNYYEGYIHCSNLKVPLISNGKVAPTFNVTTCSHKDE